MLCKISQIPKLLKLALHIAKLATKKAAVQVISMRHSTINDYFGPGLGGVSLKRKYDGVVSGKL